MAGEQAKSMSVVGIDRYPVKDKNKEVSQQYFNSVKEYMKTKYSKEVAQWVTFFGEARWWATVKAEMDIYSFGFEDNQCLFIYHKYKGVLVNGTQKESGGEVCAQVQQNQTDDNSPRKKKFKKAQA